MRRSPALSLSTFALLALAALPLALSSAPTPTRAPAAKVSSARTPVLRPVVAARYPHDRAAFTQGLQYLGGGHYLESTGQVGESDLRVSELRGAKVLWSTPLAQALPQAFGEGSTQLGSTVYQLTWQDGVALTYDARTFKETGRHRYQGEGWGLTSDGKSLIMSNGTSTLVWRDPKTFAAQRSVQVTDQGQPVRNLNELEYVQGSVYANVWLTDRIARIHPGSRARGLCPAGPMARPPGRPTACQRHRLHSRARHTAADRQALADAVRSEGAGVGAEGGRREELSD